MTVEEQIGARLTEAFGPAYFELDNESSQHSVPPNSETHFRVVMAAEAFEGKRPVARHQLVYGVLADLMQNPIHALALHLYTPEEWDRERSAPESPACLGGSKSDSEGDA